MKKILLTLVFIFACALACAGVFWIKAGLEDGFTLQAFDYGPSEYWNIGMLAFAAIVIFLSWCWYKMWEALKDVID